MASQAALELVDHLVGQVVGKGNVSTEKDKTPGAGGHRKPDSTSLASILATFIPTFLTAVLFLIVFMRLRTPYRNIYAPRTYLGVVPERDRTPSSGRGQYDWIHDFRVLDEQFVLHHQSLDGYLYLRFFKIIVMICFIGCCITWPILIPVNATGGGGASQLDKISFSNVDGGKRLYAHAVVAWIFLVIVMVIVARERIFFIGLRQAYLLSKSNAVRLSSRTVLFLSVPKKVIQEDDLHKFFGSEAKKSWAVTDHSELQKLVDDRNDLATKLEGAEVQLSRNANKSRLQRQKKGASANGQDRNEPGQPWTNKELRPKHRLTLFIGEKVDTIHWTRRTLSDVSRKIEKMRESKTERFRHHTAAIFVEFETQAAAQKAYQQIPSRVPFQMTPRYIGVQPKEVIWKNLTISASTRISQAYFAMAFVIATIVFWSIPLGFVAAISNIENLTDQLQFLRFVYKLPDPVLGLITGLLPPYLMSTFVSYVPKFFRYVAKLSGKPTIPEAEIKTQDWYFVFQVTQVFLVTTFSSGAAAVASQIIDQPSLAPTLLAQNLPKASNFYLSYFILQGTASAAKNILNYSDLFEYIAYDKFFDNTPRSKYSRYTKLKGISWGSVYPKFTNMAIIAIAYSCIAPLMLGFATIGLFLYYLSYRYNLLFTIQTKVDTKGECYARALQQLLTGVYLSELCMIGLFGISKATGPSVLMGVLLIGTVIYHVTMNRLLRPLEQYLPADLQMAEEERPLLAAEEGISPDDQEEPLSTAVRHTPSKLPRKVFGPLARTIEARVLVSHEIIKSLLSGASNDDEDAPTYSEDQLRTAYVDPALTSKTPKLWLVRDEMGISKHEIEENTTAGITATDYGAVFDAKNNIEWDKEDLNEVPIFKVPVKY